MTWKIRISPTTPKKESTRSSTTLKRNGTSSRSANTCRNSQEMLSSPLTVEAALIRTALEPRLIGKQIGLSPLLTLLALYMGYKFCGIWGMILFPIGAMLLRQLWEYRNTQGATT